MITKTEERHYKTIDDDVDENFQIDVTISNAITYDLFFKSVGGNTLAMADADRVDLVRLRDFIDFVLQAEPDVAEEEHNTLAKSLSE